MADCIEPRLREWLVGLMEESVEKSVERFSFDPAALTQARLHWSSCPACRGEFSRVESVLERVRLEIRELVRGTLWNLSNDLAAHQNNLEAPRVPDEAYAEILARLVAWGSEVQWALSFVYGEFADFTVCPELAERAQREPLWKCAEFIRSLELEIWNFVFEAVLCHELFRPLYLRFWQMKFSKSVVLDPETGESVLVKNDDYVPSNDEEDFIWKSLRKEILNIEVKSDVLYQTIRASASNYLQEFAKTHGMAALLAQRVAQDRSVPSVQPRLEVSKLSPADWQDSLDSLDSLKAGQMELVRLIERNSRPAAAYEPYLAAQLGVPLYSRLHEKTQRALQLAEYLYNINQEPDGFSLTAITMAQGYENELILRIIWPFVNELLAAGTQLYDAQGRSREQLIRAGRINPRSMTLGNAVWYLREDPIMRSKVSALGFEAEVIFRDAAWVSDLRNRAAHQFGCDRAVADNLRLRILCPHDILSRLHPMEAAAASHALEA